MNQDDQFHYLVANLVNFSKIQIESARQFETTKIPQKLNYFNQTDNLEIQFLLNIFLSKTVLRTCFLFHSSHNADNPNLRNMILGDTLSILDLINKIMGDFKDLDRRLRMDEPDSLLNRNKTFLDPKTVSTIVMAELMYYSKSVFDFIYEVSPQSSSQGSVEKYELYLKYSETGFDAFQCVGRDDNDTNELDDVNLEYKLSSFKNAEYKWQNAFYEVLKDYHQNDLSVHVDIYKQFVEDGEYDEDTIMIPNLIEVFNVHSSTNNEYLKNLTNFKGRVLYEEENPQSVVVFLNYTYLGEKKKIITGVVQNPDIQLLYKNGIIDSLAKQIEIYFEQNKSGGFFNKKKTKLRLESVGGWLMGGIKYMFQTTPLMKDYENLNWSQILFDKEFYMACGCKIFEEQDGVYLWDRDMHIDMDIRLNQK